MLQSTNLDFISVFPFMFLKDLEQPKTKRNVWIEKESDYCG